MSIFCVYISCPWPWMYEERPKNPTRSVATENAVGIGAGAQIRRLLHMFKGGKEGGRVGREGEREGGREGGEGGREGGRDPSLPPSLPSLPPLPPSPPSLPPSLPTLPPSLPPFLSHDQMWWRSCSSSTSPSYCWPHSCSPFTSTSRWAAGCI